MKGVEEKKEFVGYFIGLPIGYQNGGDTHVTVVIRHDSNENDLKELTDCLYSNIHKLLPLVVYVSPEITMRGYKNDVPTHSVRCLDEKAEKKLCKLYKRFYKQVPGHKSYPDLEMHVTVDKPERKKCIAEIIKTNKGVFVCCEAQLKRIGSKTILESTSVI